MDSQSVKTTEEGARSNGYDARKNVKGRKRHLLVDTLGLPLSVYVMSDFLLVLIEFRLRNTRSMTQVLGPAHAPYGLSSTTTPAWPGRGWFYSRESGKGGLLGNPPTVAKTP